MAKTKGKNSAPKKRELTEWHFEPDKELTAKAGYPVKNHGHRHYKLRLKVDDETGEIFLPVGYKWVSFIAMDDTTTENDGEWAFVLVKDEIHA